MSETVFFNDVYNSKRLKLRIKINVKGIKDEDVANVGAFVNIRFPRYRVSANRWKSLYGNFVLHFWK